MGRDDRHAAPATAANVDAAGHCSRMDGDGSRDRTGRRAQTTVIAK
jgi:hypothetical protein